MRKRYLVGAAVSEIVLPWRNNIKIKDKIVIILKKCKKSI